MSNINMIEQLAKRLVSGSLTESQWKQRREDLTRLLIQECNNTKIRYDNVKFAEALNTALEAFAEGKVQTSFWDFFKRCNGQKNAGFYAEQFKEENPELVRERLERAKALIEKIGKAEGLEYQDYKNKLRYPNEEKIMQQLHKWQVAEKYAQDVKDIFTGSNFVSIQKLEEASESHETNLGQLPLTMVEQNEALQLRIADIIEASYELSKQKNLYDLNRCEWSGNLYEEFSRIIPMLFESYLENGYLTFYEAQTLLAILDNKLFAAYLHMAPDTIRKKRKQLKGINIVAMREVTTANRNKVEAYD